MRTLISANFKTTEANLISLHFDTKKIRNYESDDFKGLYTFLLNLCKLIGVSEPPEKEVIILLISHVKSHHHDFSKEEIENAFSLATAGKLGFEFVHYNRITPQLISKTLKAYSRERQQRVSEFRNLEYKENLKKKEEDSKKSDEEVLKMRFENALRLHETYLQDGEVDDFGNATYKYLRSLGLIKITKDKAEDYYSKARSLVENEASSNKLKSLMSGQATFFGKQDPKDLEGSIMVKARKIALNEFFELLKDGDVEFKTLLQMKSNLNFQK